MVRKHRELVAEAQPRHGEVRRRQDDGDHGLEAAEPEKPHVLDLVGLLHEADRLLHAPAREIPLDGLPEAFAGPGRAQRGQQRHRLLAARPFHDDQAKPGCGMLRQSGRDRSVLDRHLQPPAVALERHAVAALHLARPGEVCGGPPAVPVQETAVADKPDDEVQPLLDEEVEEPVPVPAPVVHVYAAPFARPGDLPYHLRHLVVLAREPLLLRGPHRHVERHDPPAHARRGRGEAQVVSEVVAHAAPAAVPHLREERHPAVPCVRLLDVGGACRHDGVVVHACGPLRRHRVLHRGVQPLGEKMARQPLLRLLQQDVLLERAGDPAGTVVCPACIPKNICPRNSFCFFGTWGKTIPTNLLSCSRNRYAAVPSFTAASFPCLLSPRIIRDSSRGSHFFS